MANQPRFCPNPIHEHTQPAILAPGATQCGPCALDEADWNRQQAFEARSIAMSEWCDDDLGYGSDADGRL